MPATRDPPTVNVDRGELTIGGVRCVSLAERYGTPLYVMDEGRIRDNVHRLREAFVSTGQEVRVLYAVKASPNLAVLAIVRGEGPGPTSPDRGRLPWLARRGSRPSTSRAPRASRRRRS